MVVMLMMIELLPLVLLCWYSDTGGDVGGVVFVGDVGDVGLHCYNVFIQCFY
jgi:hypothetical protein